MTKHNLLILYRIFILGLQNFIRNAWLTIIALIMMVMAITFALSGIVLNITSRNVIADLSSNLKVSIYLEDEANIESIAPLRHALDNNEAITEVFYISSMAARDQFLETYGEDEDIKQAIELTGQSTFPASLEVSVEDLTQLDAVEAIALEDKYIQIVESISLGKVDAQNTISRATSIQNFLARASIILTFIFGIVSTLVIFNTIRMAIFSRREEVQIMRLIGAPNHFIHGPFLMEAVFFGVLSGAVSVSLIYSILGLFSERIQATPELVDSYLYFTNNFWVIFLMISGSILGGIAIAILACLWALKRYLRL